MAHKATNWAWEITLRMPEKFVLIALADMADEVFSCYPSQKRLAEMTGGSVRTVGRALDELEEQKLIRRETRRGANGYRVSDRYVLEVGAVPASQATEGHLTESHLTTSHLTLATISPDTQADLTRQSDVPVEASLNHQEPPMGAVAEIDIPKGSRSKVAFPNPFIVTAHMREWAAKNTESVALDAVTAEFVAYWREGEGKGRLMKNWPLTWMNRMRAVHQRNVERGWKPTVDDERKVIRGGRVVG